jgi:hypothetical protein
MVVRDVVETRSKRHGSGQLASLMCSGLLDGRDHFAKVPYSRNKQEIWEVTRPRKRLELIGKHVELEYRFTRDNNFLKDAKLVKFIE